MLIDEIDERKTSPPPPEGDARLGYAIIMSFALTLVNFTLLVVARAQYGQDDVWWPSFWLALRSLPLFSVLIYLLHPFESLTAQAIGALTGTACGGAAVWLFNNEGYYASMSKVPQIGTVWVWLIVELPVSWGAATLLIVGIYTYVSGFRVM